MGKLWTKIHVQYKNYLCSEVGCCRSPLIQRKDTLTACSLQYSKRTSFFKTIMHCKNLTSHQPKDFCPAEVFPQNLSKTCNSPAVGVTKVAINTELMLIVKFSFFLYILCKSRTKAFCVCDTSYTEYTIYILLYISITNLGLNVGVYRKMPSVLPYFSQILCSDARPFTCNIMKIHFTYWEKQIWKKKW